MGAGAQASRWSKVRILDLVSVRSGQVDPREPRYRDLPLIAPDHIESGTGRLLRKESAASQGAISGKYFVQPGDVIYSKIRPYLRKAYLCDFPALCSADMYPLSPKPDADGTFILHTVLGRDFTDFAISVSARSGIPKINRVELAEFELRVPARIEQAAIGGVLNDVDDVGASLEALIAKKQAMNQGMMQQLLTGRTRLPGFSGQWTEKHLGEIARIKTGSRNNQDKVAIGRYPFFVRSATVERIDSYSYDCEAILVPGEGGIGSIFHYVKGKFEVHQRVYKISDFGPDVDGQFVFYYMRLFFGAHATKNSVKATVDSLRLPTFQSFAMHLPGLEEQRAITQALGDAKAEIDQLKFRLSKSRAIKTGLVQELLTGRTRLPVNDAA